MTMPEKQYDDICRVCGTYAPEGGGVHDVCKEYVSESIDADRRSLAQSFMAIICCVGGDYSRGYHEAMKHAAKIALRKLEQ